MSHNEEEPQSPQPDLPEEELPELPEDSVGAQKPELKKKKRRTGPKAATRLPNIEPSDACLLRKLKMNRVKDYCLLEKDFVQGATQTYGVHASSQLTELDAIRSSPMAVANLEELISDQFAIISMMSGAARFYVPIMSFVDRELLYPGATVLVHKRVHAIVGVLADEADPMVDVLKVNRAPDESYADIGGLDEQIQEIKEAVELPLQKPELYTSVGIEPPKGVILYGPPGTGKTLLAKAVAHETSATYLRITGSELVQKYLGEGPKLVRELFRAARESAPSIIYIAELDSIGTKRYAAQSSGEREIQRTMLELLNQLDGFDSLTDVKVIVDTNRIEALDPALIRPGRIDRKIFCPLPGLEARRQIFAIHTRSMTLSEDVDLEYLIQSKTEMSGADIKAICTEAGMFALRERRMRVAMEDFRQALEKVMFKKTEDVPEGLYF